MRGSSLLITGGSEFFLLFDEPSYPRGKEMASMLERLVKERRWSIETSSFLLLSVLWHRSFMSDVMDPSLGGSSQAPC